MNWYKSITGDPIGWLLEHASLPVQYQMYRDLLDDEIHADALRRYLPESREVKEIFARQLPCGGWFRKGDLYHKNRPLYAYGAIQQLDRLADYGLTFSDLHVQVRVKSRRYQGIPEGVTDPGRIADFLEYRLMRHPQMTGAILRLEGLPANPSREELEAYATRLAFVVIRPEPQ